MQPKSERFDDNLERVVTREQAERHLRKVLEISGPYNQSIFEPEIELDPNLLTDLTIQFLTDEKKFAETEDPYNLFLKRYNLENATIPGHKFQISVLAGRPCLRVRLSDGFDEEETNGYSIPVHQ